jgi:hypothetical protein
MSRELASLERATGWLNSAPLTEEDLRGRVVLVQFCTYTCINWIRTLPYVRAWAEKYEDDGLVVIGGHTPEFSFEHDVENIRPALESMNVDYPIAIDNNYGVWSGFDNNYWPALYLLDDEGGIQYHHFGEGNYEESERMIQDLLGQSDVDLVSVDGLGVEAAADWGSLESPETYLGSARSANRVADGGPQLRLNEWSLSGDWKQEAEAALLQAAGGQIAYRFHARDLNLVMGPPAGVGDLRFRVEIDGEAPNGAHGVDVDEQGSGTATEQRLYQLVRQRRPIADRTFQLTFLDPGAEAYSFTFG